MPYVEGVHDLADWLADEADVYGFDQRCVALNRTRLESQGETFDESVDDLTEHVEDCRCRSWWVANVEVRIRQAADNDSKFDAAFVGNRGVSDAG